ncbi:hypothetical protein [Emticicia sp. BO119]|uniref:hypothetical protein n=1 Tax=Emticicia sp. BO119 TaxID=2757768 RepID=UPI0015F0A374|nr:hypothetical protein [Emticicia sp. BO119]MBA4850745.1 hypothetical protein [Emticicia sp. BO119]
MKKISFLSCIILIYYVQSKAQSTTITPDEGIIGQYTNQKLSVHTQSNTHGMVHTNGDVSIATYIGDNAAWLMTKSNHPLYFSTNNNVNPLNPSMVILTNGNVGIGTNNPTEKLHVIGNARISGLSGNGAKFVRTDNSGVLSSTPQVSYMNIPRASFLAVNGNMIGVNNNNNGIYCTGNTVGSLEAPINLPDGSIISNIEAYFADNGSKNVRVQLYRRAYTDNAGSVLGTVSSTGAAGNMEIQSEDVDIVADNVVDNNAYVYYLRVTAIALVNNIPVTTTWGDGTTLTINQIKVTYSY